MHAQVRAVIGWYFHTSERDCPLHCGMLGVLLISSWSFLTSCWCGVLQKLRTLVMSQESHTPGPGVRETERGASRKWNSFRSSCCLIPRRRVMRWVMKCVSYKWRLLTFMPKALSWPILQETYKKGNFWKCNLTHPSWHNINLPQRAKVNST